jgi:hypothetical protein
MKVEREKLLKLKGIRVLISLDKKHCHAQRIHAQRR